MTKKQKFFAHEKNTGAAKIMPTLLLSSLGHSEFYLIKAKNQNQEQKTLSKKIEYLQEMSKIQLNHSEDEQTTHEQHPSQK